MDFLAVLQDKLNTPLTVGNMLSVCLIAALFHWNVLKAIAHVSGQVGDIGRLLLRERSD